MFAVFKREKRLYIIGGLLLAASFMINIFGVGPNKEWFNEFEQYSENFALATADCSAKGTYNGNLIIPPEYVDGQKSGNPAKDAPGCTVYASQFGLQGFVYSIIPKVSKSQAVQKVLWTMIRLVLIAGLVAVLLLFLGFVHRQYGKAVAITTGGFLLLSDWLVGYARNLYWVAFLFFVPFIVALYVYPVVRKDRKKLRIFWAVMAGLFFLKFLTGYEFFSVIAIAACVPVVYWEASLGANLKAIIKRCVPIVVGAAAAFVLAMGVQMLSLLNDYNSMKDVSTAIAKRGEKRSDPSVSYRSTVLNFYKTSPEVYGVIDQEIVDIDGRVNGQSPGLVYLGLVVVNYLSLPVITIPVMLKGLTPVILQSFAFWILLTWLSVRFLKRRRIVNARQIRALQLSLLAGAAAILSWPIVAAGHFFEHTHLNAFIFYLPFMLFAYMTIAIVIVVKGRGLWKSLTAKR